MAGRSAVILVTWAGCVLSCLDGVSGIWGQSFNFHGRVKWEKRKGFVHKAEYRLASYSTSSFLTCGGYCVSQTHCCSYSFGRGRCFLSVWCSFTPQMLDADPEYSVATRNNVLCNLRGDHGGDVFASPAPPKKVLSYAQAQVLCPAYGATLAAPHHVQTLYDNGRSQCSWAWVNDGTRMFPMRDPTSNCATVGVHVSTLDQNSNAWCHFHTDALQPVGDFDAWACFPLQ